MKICVKNFHLKTDLTLSRGAILVPCTNLSLGLLLADELYEEEAHLLVLLVAELEGVLAGLGGGIVSVHGVVRPLLRHRGVVFLKVHVGLVHPDDALVEEPVGLLHVLHSHLLAAVQPGEGLTQP